MQHDCALSSAQTKPTLPSIGEDSLAAWHEQNRHETHEKEKVKRKKKERTVEKIGATKRNKKKRGNGKGTRKRTEKNENVADHPIKLLEVVQIRTRLLSDSVSEMSPHSSVGLPLTSASGLGTVAIVVVVESWSWPSPCS